MTTEPKFTNLNNTYATPQVTFPAADRAGFGELRVASMTAELQVSFPYNINSRQIKTRTNNGASTSHANGLATVSSGTNTNSFGSLKTQEAAHYDPGQGLVARFTALGLDVVAQNMQAAMEQLGKQKPRIVPATGLPS